MHIALVSTFPPAKCGIANYSQHLVRSLRAEGAQVTVIAEQVEAADRAADEAEGVVRAWRRGGDFCTEILHALASAKPDLVHIQHEEAFMGQDSRLPKLLRSARELGIPGVVTLHSVYDGRWGVLGLRYSGRTFQRQLALEASRLIVHQVEGCEAVLRSQGIAAKKVCVIAHGTLMAKSIDRGDARRDLGLAEDGPLVLAIGFIHKKKGLHTLVQAMPQVLQSMPSTRLLVAGSFRERPWDHLYNRRLRQKIAIGAREGWLDMREGFHPSNDMEKMMAAADLLALPYRQRYGSASGILHLALGAGLPVLCADGYKFAEAKRSWGNEFPQFFPHPDDAPAWGRAIAQLLSQADTLATLASRSRALGGETSWKQVGKQHLAAFEEAFEEKRHDRGC